MQSTFNLTALTICVIFVIAGSTIAQDSESKKTVEPVFRVPRLKRQARQGRQVRPVRQARQTQPRPRPQNSIPNIQPQNLQPQNLRAQSVIERPIDNTPRSIDPRPVVQQPLPQVAPPVARVADAGELAVPDKKIESLVPENIRANDLEAHPLDRAIEIARHGLDGIRQNVADYTAILVKRERVDGRLSEPNYMRIKIRHPRVVNGQQVPFSIYMKFLKPKAASGREVIWVHGQNNNNLIAHETGALLRFKNFYLEPTGFLAMKGNKYPIYDAGLENLTLKLIEKAERDRKAGLCEVDYSDDAEVNKRPCTLIKVTHPQRRQPYEFHVAKVYIDNELQMPVRYESMDWPDASGRVKIMEQYTYINIKTNVGLTDADFAITNPTYGFAR